jgi:ethanolamine ammonia-lyase small subunit
VAGITRSAPNDDVWARLRQWTPARIGLGRAGSSLPTAPMLAFELAHARARDAVHASLDADALARALKAAGFGEPIIVRSQARDRMEYLLRPDLGRCLDPDSRDRLRPALPSALAVVIGDGLSAVAPARHAVPLLEELRRQWDLPENVTVVVANLARVALGDQIGELLGADAVVVLLGERPGLSSPDSLGIYLTWAPRVGRTDAERNCISNVRPEGLPYAQAATRLAWLLQEARRLRISGVALKDDSESAPKILPQGRVSQLP